ncbi:4'-phosphopantetheinyl transferase family protein [Geodermatophilus sp. SYSU D00697]
MRLPGRGATALAAGGLRPGVCQVWWASTGDLRPQHDALLAPADLERRARLAEDDDRRHSTMASAVVRAVLGTALGVSPTGLVVDRTCPGCGRPHGRPRLPALPDLGVSVTHSAGCVAVAVLPGGAVGIDVEEVVRPGTDLDELASVVLAPEERAELARAPLGYRHRAFTTWWTRKEALLKATGEGLSTPLETVVLSPPWTPARVLRWSGTGPAWLSDLRPPAGLAGALAGLGRPPVAIEERDAGPLLDQTSRRLPGATTRSQRYP